MAATADAVISLQGVNHFFGEGTLRKQILFDITARIQPGELVMVMGPSGSGKTTLLNLIGALRGVTTGSLRVLGTELGNASNAARAGIRRRMGFIFQQHHLLESLTTRQNVQMGIGAAGVSRREARTRAAAMLEEVGLSGYSDALPRRLSVGQRQRVAVARALVRRPEVLLADEPTASLDRQTGREIVELLRRLARKQGCAVVIVTHDNRILDVADRLMYLEDGRLSSFAAATSEHAVHLLTALRSVTQSGQADAFLRRMQEAQFVEMLRALGAESEQFLNVLDLGGTTEARQVFTDLLVAVLRQAGSIIGADAGGIWLATEKDGLQRVAGFGEAAAEPPGAALECLRSQTALRHDGVLCVPLPNREYDVFAVAEMSGALSEDAERLFRDFARPLGLLCQACGRLESYV